MGTDALRKGPTSSPRGLSWALLGVITFNCWALGAVHPPVVAISCVALMLAISWLGPASARSLGSSAWLALAAVCALQCVPLPLAWLRLLSAENAETWAQALRLLGTAQPVPLSIEPESTRLEVAKFVLYAGVWWSVSALPRHLPLRRIAGFSAALASSVLVLTALHSLFGLTRVYGVYQPQNPTAGLVGPLLNENTLSGLQNLGVFAALSLALSKHGGARLNAVGIALGALLVGGSLLTGSRAGALTLVLGLLVLAGLLLWKDRRRGHIQSGRRAIVVVAAGSLGVTFLALAMSASLRQELSNASVEKLDLVRWGFEVAQAHPWVGTGRGAFGAEVGRFRDAGGERVFTHAENWAVEAVTGWGWPLGVLVVTLFVWALIPKRPLQRSSERLALSVGVVVVATQNLLDLGLDVVPGLALPFVLVLATLARHGGRDATTSAGPLRRLALGRWSVGAALGLAGLWVLLAPPQLAHAERRRLASTFAQAGPSEALTSTLHAAVARHPGDGYLLRLAAADALSRQAPNTLAWINASLRREPHFGRTYLLLAEALKSAGYTDQALIALREAARRSPELTQAVTERARAWAPESALRAVPDGRPGVQLLLGLAANAPEPALELAFLERALAQAGDHDDRVHTALADAWTRAARANQPPCDEAPADCLDAARDHLDRAYQLARGELPPTLIATRARWLRARGDAETAVETLRRDCSARSAECGALLLEIAAELSTRHLSAAAKDYLASHCVTPAQCGHAEATVARLFEARGDLRSALEHGVRAAELRNDPALWMRASELAARQGLPGRAERLRERAEEARVTGAE